MATDLLPLLIHPDPRVREAGLTALGTLDPAGLPGSHSLLPAAIGHEDRPHS